MSSVRPVLPTRRHAARFAAFALLVWLAPVAASAQLRLELSASRSALTVGDRVTIDAAVRTDVPVEQLTLAVELGAGLTVVHGTLQLDGAPTTADPGSLPLGTLVPGEVRRVRLVAAAGFAGAERTVSLRAAGVSAGVPVEAGPESVTLHPGGGELLGHGGLYGRICFDVNADGVCAPDEPAAARAVIFLEDGSHAQSDARGRYQLAPVLPGWHLLVAGPGPLSLGLRPGAFPALPRNGAAKASTWVPAGQYLAQDVALPVPAGVDPASLTATEELQADEETDVEPSPAARDGGGNLVGFAPRPAGENAGALEPLPRERGAGAPALPGEPEKLAVDAGKPRPNPKASTAIMALAEGQFSVDLSGGLAGVRVRPSAGRLALILQDDFGDLGRATVIVDTRRDGRSQTLSLLDPRGGYPELGDDARVSMSVEDKLYVRLDMPQLSLQGGRLGTALRENELLYLERSYVGVEASVGNDWIQARAFGGFSSDVQQRDVFPGGTGPFTLSATPVLAGSEQVDVEVRADGELRQRIPLQRGIDYFLDPASGRLDVARPLPPTSGLGDELQVVVRYQVIGQAPLTSGLVAGGRAQLGFGARRLGLSVLHQAAPTAGGASLTALALDSRLSFGPFGVDGAVGFAPQGTGGPLERSAGRLRLNAELFPGGELFALGSATGARWEPTIRSTPVPFDPRSPFALLDAFRFYPKSLPALGLLQYGARGAPFVLSEDDNILEFGGGARVRAGPVEGLSLYRQTRALDGPADAREAAEVAARTDVGGVHAYAAHLSSAPSGELLGPAGGHRTRQSLLGARFATGDWATELEYRHVLDEEDPIAAGLHDVALKTKFTAFAPVQPAALFGQSWLTEDGQSGGIRHYGVGLESALGGSFRAFGYGVWSVGEGPLASGGRSLLAGLAWDGGPGRSVNVRYDHRTGATGTAHYLAWDARQQLLSDWFVQSDGQLELGGAHRLLRLSSGYVGAGPVRVLARAEDEVSLEPDGEVWNRVASVDGTLKLGASFRLDGKYLVRLQEARGEQAIANLGGAALYAELPSGPYLLLGSRYLRDPLGGAWGGYAEAGITLGKAFRIGAGFNLAQRDEVFTISHQTPGLYLSVSGADATPLGARPVQRPQVTAPPVIAEAKPAPVVPPKPKPAPAPTTRVVRGRLYGDRNGNGVFDPTEPTFEGVRIVAGELSVETGRLGEFELREVPAAVTTVEAQDPNQLLVGHLPAEPKLVAQTPSELRVDLLLRQPKAPIEGLPIRLNLAGANYRGFEIERATFPLASWVAGLPLSAQESKRIAVLAEAVMADPDLRLMVVAHAQTLGPPQNAVKRAWKGGQLFRRYIQATQMIPGKRVMVTVIEPNTEKPDPLGHVDLILVRLVPARAELDGEDPEPAHASAVPARREE